MAEAAQFSVHDFSTNYQGENMPQNFATTPRPSKANSTSPTPPIGISKPKPHQSANMPHQQRARGRFYTKAKLAFPHILILFVGLAHIITTLTSASAGLQGLSATVKHSLDQASVELQAQSSLKWREDVLYHRLDGLLHTKLSLNPTETHRQCLIRGLEVANYELFNLGFQYEDIRDQSWEWAVENCGRLRHTLQARQLSVQQVVLMGWTKATYRFRRVTERAFSKIAEKTSSVQSWLSQKTGICFLKHPDQAGNHRSRSVPIEPEQPRMPFGYDLGCDEAGNNCWMYFNDIRGGDRKRTAISHEAIADRKRRIQELFKSYHSLDALRRTTASLVSWLLPLELLCLIAYLVTMIANAEFPAPAFLRNELSNNPYFSCRPYTRQEEGAAMYIVVQLAVMVAGVLMAKKTHEGLASTLGRAVLLITASVSGLIQAFIPVTDMECIPQMFGAIKQTYLIAQQPDVLSIRVMTPFDWKDVDEKIKEVVDRAYGKSGEQKATSPQLSPPATSSKAPSLSPHLSVLHATISEEAPRNETQADLNAGVESDHKPESDGEDYVDLAGGITPTTTKDADWSIVEA
jgi:hypothetical protein